MLTRRFFAISLLGATALATVATAQRAERKMDPEVMAYKLSMEKIRAYDGVLKKLYEEVKTDPALRATFSSSGDAKTLNDMVKKIDSNPKMLAAVKAGGMTSREFCLIPMGIMAAGGAYMIQTQYKKDVSNLATPENLAFYGAHKSEIDKITSSWSRPSDDK
jgi:hypothetical protein